MVKWVQWNFHKNNFFFVTDFEILKNTLLKYTFIVLKLNNSEVKHYYDQLWMISCFSGQSTQEFHRFFNIYMKYAWKNKDLNSDSKNQLKIPKIHWKRKKVINTKGTAAKSQQNPRILVILTGDNSSWPSRCTVTSSDNYKKLKVVISQKLK